MPRRVLASLIAALLVAGCSRDAQNGYQGWVEGEYVHVASPVGGRLERLLVARGQQVAARATLFRLEADEETAAEHGLHQLRQAREQVDLH